MDLDGRPQFRDASAGDRDVGPISRWEHSCRTLSIGDLDGQERQFVAIRRRDQQQLCRHHRRRVGRSLAIQPDAQRVGLDGRKHDSEPARRLWRDGDRLQPKHSREQGGSSWLDGQEWQLVAVRGVWVRFSRRLGGAERPLGVKSFHWPVDVDERQQHGRRQLLL